METDENLVDRWQKSDDYEAANIIFKRYEEKLLFYIYTRVGNYHDAQDILNETFMRVSKYIASFSFKSSFKTWLYTIANNVVNNYFKQSVKSNHLESYSDIIDSTETSWYNDDAQALHSCLQQLPERDKSMLLLRYSKDTTLMEVANLFALSAEGVRKILVIALEKVRQCLYRKWGGKYE